MLKLLDCSHQELVLDYILRNEVETVLLYGNVQLFGLKNLPEIRRCADYYGYFEGDLLEGIIAFYNLGSCIPHYRDKNAIPEFVELMKHHKFEVMLGMKHIIEPLMIALGQGKPYKSIDEEMYMLNKDFKPFINNAFKLYDVDNQNDEHIDFCAKISAECFDEPRTLEQQRAINIQKPSHEELMVAYLEGRPAAQASVHGYTPHYAQIGAVGTLPEYRNKGASKTVVSKLCECIIHKGRIPSLMVRKNNLPAVKVYEALGFTKYDDYLMVWY